MIKAISFVFVMLVVQAFGADSDVEGFNSGRSESSCPPGFRKYGFMDCIDIDECAVGSRKRCGPNAACKNKEGSYKCYCLPGFYPNAHGHCVDYDECEYGYDLCIDYSETCWNTHGGYKCECKTGWVKDWRTGNCNPKYNYFYHGGGGRRCSGRDCGGLLDGNGFETALPDGVTPLVQRGDDDGSDDFPATGLSGPFFN